MILVLPVTCGICGSHFKSPGSYKKHYREVHAEPTCGTCRKKFTTIEQLREHCKIHGVTVIESRNKLNKDKAALQEQDRKHRIPLVRIRVVPVNYERCRYCGKKIDSSSHEKNCTFRERGMNMAPLRKPLVRNPTRDWE